LSRLGSPLRLRPIDLITSRKLLVHEPEFLLWYLGRRQRGESAMKVPYAKKWWRETDALTTIVLGCGLVEELKWGKPCFTYQKKNVAIIIALKEACVLSFFKGALLKDPKHVFQKIAASQAGAGSSSPHRRTLRHCSRP
jgi:Domain of unknown function (DU1801)